MKVYLAVDAGGTKTDYVVGDESRVLARVRGGSIKRMRVDAETAERNLEVALRELEARAGVSLDAVTCTCIGTAGEKVPLVVDWLREAFGRRVGGRLLLVGDVEIALDAAFHGGAGVLVLAGTGSNVAGRTQAGELMTVGGWGPVLADQGSGHRIGVEALRAIFAAQDEERATALLPAVLEFWKLESMDALVGFANASPGPDFSKLTELVLRCAEEGDAVAREVLEREGESLARLVTLMLERLERAGTQGARVAFAGSIMEKIAPVREALEAAVRREFAAVRFLSGVVDPVEGALWRARDAG